ncbi:MAG: hypothetical protein WCO57_14035 [Verrucomicrobiota bacterium]
MKRLAPWRQISTDQIWIAISSLINEILNMEEVKALLSAKAKASTEAKAEEEAEIIADAKKKVREKAKEMAEENAKEAVKYIEDSLANTKNFKEVERAFRLAEKAEAKLNRTKPAPEIQL